MASINRPKDTVQLPSSAHLTFSDNNYHADFTARLVKLRNQEKYTDVFLTADNVTISCHRVALAAASSYFEKKIEAADVSPPTLTFENISSDILEAVVEFIYTARISICVDKVKYLAAACDMLELVTLKDACDKFLSSNITINNAMGLYAFARKNNLPVSALKAKEFLLSWPEAFVEQGIDSEFKALDEKALISIIFRDDLTVQNECVVFKLAERWFEADSNRKTDTSLSNVLSHVRFPMMDPEFLLTTVESNPLMKPPKCQKMLNEAKNCIILPKFRDEIKGPRGTARKIPDLMILGGGKSGSDHNVTCWVMGVDGSKSGVLTELPDEQANFTYNMAAFVYGNRIVMTGGNKSCYFDSPATNTAWELDMSSKKWVCLPPMIQARGGHGMAAGGQYLYVCGGYGTPSAERFDMLTKQWTRIPDMPKSVDQCQVISVKAKDIYVICGSNQTIQHYDIVANVWQLKSQIPCSCWWSTAIYLDRDIYVVGGYQTYQCLKYSPSLDSWTVLCNPIVQHDCPSAVVYDNKILLCGGGRPSATGTIEQYDPRSNKWCCLKPTLPTKLAGHNMLLGRYVWK